MPALPSRAREPMIAKIATATLALLTLAAVLAPASSADPIGVGDCHKSGACASACLRDDCATPGDWLVCVGVSYEVPACAHDPTADHIQSADLRCMGAPCDVGNAVCWILLHAWCLG